MAEPSEKEIQITAEDNDDSHDYHSPATHPQRHVWARHVKNLLETKITFLDKTGLGGGQDTNEIAAIMMESICGAAGVLIHPEKYLQGVRALCDKYEILYIADEVMVGWGRTGKLWGFQHYEGLVPDIVTSAKGLSGAYMPLAMVAMSSELQAFFKDNPIGWGSTYQSGCP